MNAYDEIPYPAAARAQTHPDRMAARARLLGLDPPDPSTARVLEIGSSDGGNLIPMAFGSPEGSFVGLDLSGAAIARGQKFAAGLGLANVRLLHMDLMDAGPELGEFDYIVSHGVYSWIPEPARDKLMAITGELLAPGGVAYISFNVCPGGYFPRIMREMMSYHARGQESPEDRYRAANEFLSFLARSMDPTKGYQALIRDEAELLLARPSYQVLHNELADHHHPVYFHEFVEHARRHGLEFLTEADPGAPAGPAVSNLGADIVESEQYADFILGRRFRRTLLCRQGAAVAREADVGQLATMCVSSQVAPSQPPPSLEAGVKAAFTCVALGRSGEVTVDGPLAKAALLELSEAWPASLLFTDLAARAAARVDHAAPSPGDSQPQLASLISTFYKAGIIDLTAGPDRFAATAGPRPEASLLARLQLATQNEVANLRHSMIRVEDAISKSLLLLLDGTRDRPALLAADRRDHRTDADGR